MSFKRRKDVWTRIPNPLIWSMDFDNVMSGLTKESVMKIEEVRWGSLVSLENFCTYIGVEMPTLRSKSSSLYTSVGPRRYTVDTLESVQ